MKVLYKKINNFLSNYLGFRLKRDITAPKDFKNEYNQNFSNVRKYKVPFNYVTAEFRYDVGHHPEDYKDFECSFATDNIASLNPENILDIGSYRHFIMGLLAHFKVTTVDVRKRSTAVKNETIITCDSKRLPMQDDFIDLRNRAFRIGAIRRCI